MEWSLGRIAAGYAIEADGRKVRQDIPSGAVDRAGRALELLSRVIREEDIEMSLVRCSFCLKGNSEVEKLLEGSQGYICDVCTATAVSLLERHAD